MMKTAVKTYKILLRRPGLKKGKLRAIFVTDLHNARWMDDPAYLPELIGGLMPDLILLGGDILTAHPGETAGPAISFVKRMTEIAPVFYALGNHEYRCRIYPEVYGTMYRELTEALISAGVTFLDNERKEFGSGRMELEVIGLSLPREKYVRFGHAQLCVKEIDDLIGRPDPKKATILLAHNPKYVRAYLDWGADLTLCGHYHGGLARVGRHTGLISPDLELFPKNAYGRFGKNGRSLIVSAGAGEHTIPVRIGNPREIVVLELKT